MNKICTACKKLKPLTEFHKNGTTVAGTPKYKSNCKSCISSKNRQNRVDLRNTIEQVLGQYGLKLECSSCGYKRNKAALCFHHLDPSEKELTFAGLVKFSKEELDAEIDKCVILCHNCHMEEHYPHLNID